MKVFKLTNGNWQTKNNTKWGPGVTHTAPGTGKLCGPGWIHFYYSAELAALLHPVHVCFDSPVLWAAKTGRKTLFDRGIKGGAAKLTTVEQIPLPEYSTEQRIAFAIHCASHVFKSSSLWLRWADQWLTNSGWKPRSFGAAKIAGQLTYGFDSGAARSASAATRAVEFATVWRPVNSPATCQVIDNAVAVAAARAAANAASYVNDRNLGRPDFSFLQVAALKAADFKG